VVEGRVAVLADLERVRLRLDVGDDDARVEATLTPRSGGGPASAWISSMTTGSAAGLLAMPAASGVAVLVRDGEEARARQARVLEEGLVASLGERLGEQDKKRLRATLEAATRARGDEATVAWLPGEARGMLVRAPVRDAAAASDALRGGVELARAEPFRAILRVREVTMQAEDLPDVGKVARATLLREPPKGTPPRAGDAGARRAHETVGLAWSTGGEVLVAGAGKDPPAILRAGVAPAASLADVPAVVTATKPLGDWTTTAVVAQPLLFDPNRALLPPAPLVLALGRRGDEGVLYLHVADALLREAARAQLGL